MKLLSFSLLILACSGPAWALDGLVRLPDGQPAADATVSILGRPGSTRTGPDGRFTWLPDPQPPFEVLVILPGGVYTPPVLVERLPENAGPVEIRLKATLSESVTVDAGSTPHTEAPPAAAAAILLAEDLARRAPDNLAAAIESVPGAGRLEEGHAAVPSLRGMARGRTLILLDGARVGAERRAGPSATFLDPFFLEAIEIARGPGAVGYGSDAFGGVIHARTRQAVPGSPWAGRAQAVAGVGTPQASAAGEVSKGLAQGGFILQGRYRSFEDYQSPQGPIGNSSFRDGGLRGRFDQEWGPGRLGLAFESDLGRDLGKPAADSNRTRAYYPLEDSHRVNLGYAGDPRGRFSRWALDGFLGSYRLVTRRDRLPTASEPRQVSESDVRARDYGLRLTGATAVRGFRVEGGLDLAGRFDLEALGSVTRYDPQGRTAGIEEETSIANAARRDLGLYASFDGRLRSRLLASGGMRFDTVAASNRGGHFGNRDASHTALSGFLALTAGPAFGTTATGQVARGFRDPTLSDRYFRGVSGRGFVTGWPDLQPERSLQYDLALRRAGRLRTALYAYRYRLTDLVERYRLGDDYFFRNRGRAVVRGLELEAQGDLVWGLSLELGAQAAQGEAEDGSPLADVPPEGLTLTLRRPLGSRGDVSLRGLWRARDADPGPTEKETPGYASLDLSGRWRLGRLEARLLLSNLLDQGYLQTPDELTVLAPGRSAIVTLAVRF
jgi:outer membrane receptor protein involved in Fe transport